MLVLLVIFIITAPLLSLRDPARPAERSRAAGTGRNPPSSCRSTRTAQLYWDAEPLADDALRHGWRMAGAEAAPPEVHLRADKATRYERIAFVLSTAQQAGLTKIGFVTEPAPAAPESSRDARRAALAALFARGVAPWRRSTRVGGSGTVDDDGTTVTLAQPATRIVSLAPHLTEQLFAIGAGDRIVGTTEYADFPPPRRPSRASGARTASISSASPHSVPT